MARRPRDGPVTSIEEWIVRILLLRTALCLALATWFSVAVRPVSASGLRDPAHVPHAEPKSVQAPRHRLVFSNVLVLRLNPVGMAAQVRLGYQLRLFDTTVRQGPLFRDTFLFLGISPRINPTSINLGPAIEIQPLSMFNLRVAFEFISFFSTLGLLQSFSSPVDEYDDRLLRDCASTDRVVLQARCGGASEPRNYKASGLHLMIEPLLQAKFGPIAIRNKLSFEYWYLHARAGDRVFYDIILDTLAPRNGWVMANDLDVLFVSMFGLTAGLRYSVVQPLYRAADFRPGEESVHDNGHQRLGPLIAFTFFDRGYTGFNKPTLLLIMGWYLDHRYRGGQAPAGVLPGAFVQSPGMPYLLLGFAFQSSFFKRSRIQDG